MLRAPPRTQAAPAAGTQKLPSALVPSILDAAELLLTIRGRTTTLRICSAREPRFARSPESLCEHRAGTRDPSASLRAYGVSRLWEGLYKRPVLPNKSGVKIQPRPRVRSGGPGEKRAAVRWLPSIDFWGRVGPTSDTHSGAAQGISCYG